MARRDLRRVVLDVWEGIVYMGEGKKREESCETMNYWREENGKFSWFTEQQKIFSGYGMVLLNDGREIDTRTAKQILKNEERFQDLLGNGTCVTVTYRVGKKLYYQQKLCAYEEGFALARGSVYETGKTVEVKKFFPIIMETPEQNVPDIFRSLSTKMLLVPYDNTMWVRYEAVPLRPGRTSYDMTALYSESNRSGIMMGAVDFDTWKNAVRCSGNDARVMECICGVADAGTHDTCEHGTVKGERVESSGFLFLYGEDYRTLLETYGKILKRKNPPMKWKEGVPFGWNSWSGLAMNINEKNYQEAGEYLGEILQKVGFENNKTTYVNFDAGWNRLSEEQLVKLNEHFHGRNQKTGIYLSPFAFFAGDEKINNEIPSCPGHTFEEILLKDSRGNILSRVDGAVPMDVTHPLWKKYTKNILQKFAEWGFDYLKLDFLSHGAMEGCHYNKDCQTGRQAIAEGYRFLKENLSEEKLGRPFFLSLSIAPLFPQGMGHARRFSCDAFGTAEDTEYVLNALTYAWWQNGTLYQYNDPDHISLYRSFNYERTTEFGEAKARYTSAAISGTVMMLSEDFGEKGIFRNEDQENARIRAQELCSQREIQKIAASGISFRPAESAGTGASSWYTAQIHGQKYVAVFHLKKTPASYVFDLEEEGVGGSEAVELWTGATYKIEDGKLHWSTNKIDAAVFAID